MAKVKITKKGRVIVIDTDLGFKRIQKEFLFPIFVDVGILEKDGLELKNGSSSSTLAEVAHVHEFGLPEKGIPQRSFLRSTVDANRGYIAELTLAVSSVIAGVKKIAAVSAVGKKVVKDIVNRIRGGIGPSLKTKTVAKKGHSTPLIDTEQLINSIDSEVL